MKLTAITCVGLLALCGACEKKAHGGSNPPPAPSNTNLPDATASDTELANKVRQALVSDASLSPTVTGLQITAANGAVTLRGSVKAQKDKDAIGQKARGVAGVMSVNNELTVSSGG